MSQVTTPTQPGWLPDPSGRYEWRYWDGGWTNRVANSTPTGAEPAAAAPAPASSMGPVPSAPASAPVTAPPEPAAATVAGAATDGVAPPTESSEPLTARDAVPRVPFGTDPESTTAV